MALRRQLSEMRDLVRQQTDQVNGTFVTDAELTNWINQGILDFWRCMTKANPDWYLLTIQLSTTAGTLEYNMYSAATDWTLVRGVDLVDGDRRHTLRTFQFLERNRNRSSPFTTVGDRPRYRVIRNSLDGSTATLAFDRDPGTNTYDVHYVPAPTRLANATDNFDGVLGFEDWPIAHASYMVHKKAQELEEAAACKARVAEMKAEAADIAAQRHMDGAPRIARTRRRSDSNYDEFETGW